MYFTCVFCPSNYKAQAKMMFRGHFILFRKDEPKFTRDKELSRKSRLKPLTFKRDLTLSWTCTSSPCETHLSKVSRQSPYRYKKFGTDTEVQAQNSIFNCNLDLELAYVFSISSKNIFSATFHKNSLPYEIVNLLKAGHFFRAAMNNNTRIYSIDFTLKCILRNWIHSYYLKSWQ